MGAQPPFFFNLVQATQKSTNEKKKQVRHTSILFFPKKYHKSSGYFLNLPQYLATLKPGCRVCLSHWEFARYELGFSVTLADPLGKPGGSVLHGLETRFRGRMWV